MLPHFLRDLASGWLEVDRLEMIDVGLRRLSRLAGELEQALPQIVALRIEPIYLHVI